MLLINKVLEIREHVKNAKKEGKKVGLVPTMGFFHDGHLELMRQARKECDVVIVSIFVNPTQFGPGEDYEDYPRDLERDMQLAEEVGVDVIFNPSVEEMYPDGFSTYVEVKGITGKLCGRSRPGHFKGVATIVTKLFNSVQPDVAFFGQKDAQQVLVIKKMVKELNIDVEIRTVPIVREEDGIAMSSRNLYLNDEERKAARILYRSIQKAQQKVQEGERDVNSLKGAVIDMISSEPLAKIDYVELLTYPKLEEKDVLEGKMLLALAVKIGKARLIDNAILEG
ncbi:MAG: pantoate--beta-alanine ligase [Clostridia bacterium]|nr:pantoate--beta-alanine ligase [Clostridia bacterium]